MNLISLLLVLVLVGAVLYLIELLVPMDPKMKQVIRVIALVGVLFYILQSFGLIGGPVVKLR